MTDRSAASVCCSACRRILPTAACRPPHGDPDGDGFVEYARAQDSGLINQGWKDSPDSIFHADGRDATGPIALCEVQGYVFAAKIQAANMSAAAALLGAAAAWYAAAVGGRQREGLEPIPEFWDWDRSTEFGRQANRPAE